MEQKQKNLIIGAVLFLALVIISTIIIFNSTKRPDNSSTKTPPQSNTDKNAVKVSNKATISIDKPSDKKLMEDRKAEYGIEKGLDMVIKSDEKVMINNKTIDMEKLEEREMIEKGELVSSDLNSDAARSTQDYGIYVVKKGDNLWDIHFRLLRELFEKKGIKISILADEPLEKGYSSGVGKILKFSEKMVRVYSLDNDNLYFDINNIEPKGKVVIYKMNEIESLLKDMTVRDVDNVVFDGKNLWIES